MLTQGGLRRSFSELYAALAAAVGRLNKSFNPFDTIARVRSHRFTPSDSVYIIHVVNTAFWIWIMRAPGFPLKLLIPAAHILLLLIPFSSQFLFPALPVTTWVLCYYASQFIPNQHRPSISVSVLPTLESVLFGANISDILTRFTHPVLDVIAWLPYGVIHFVLPFVIAAFTWVFRPNEALRFWARAFGWLNFVGVIIQILLPCAAPWYEVIFGLMPANYGMKGSPGGLLRIDRIFGSEGYTLTFSNSPVIFGAFPSLHSACATIEALFLSHFFPQTTPFAWTYAGILYWATMYLTHHYLIDVVGGSCMAVLFFYCFLPDDLRGAFATAAPGTRPSKYTQYGLEAPTGGAEDYELGAELSALEDEDEPSIASYRSANGHANGSATQKAVRQNHKHTASIASLIKANDRVEEGWSPIGNGSFVFPSPTRENTPR
jgi:membrane-associated phospholipid phosphatase